MLARTAAEFVKRACAAGIDRGAMLAHAQLEESALSDLDGRVPLPSLYAVLEGMEALSGDRFLHLRVTPDFDFGSLDALAFLVMSSPTLGAGLQAMVRYQRAWNDGERYELEHTARWAKLVYRPWGARRRAHTLMAEMFAADMAVNAALMTGGPFSGARARFVARAPADRAALEALLGGARPAFGCAQDELWIARADLDRPIAREGQEAMFAFFTRHLDEQLRALPSESIAARTRDLVLRQPTLDLSLDGVARAMHLSPRTLQRQLAAEGTSMRALAEETRRARALTLLERGQSIHEVAAILGYTASAFHRAFRRWTGQTPEAYRRRAREQD